MILASVGMVLLGVILAFVLRRPARTIEARGALDDAFERAASRGGETASVRPSPPRWAAVSSNDRGVVTDPRTPGYDPGALVDIGLSPERVYAAEPRDPAWAPILEKRISTRLTADLAVMVPSAQVAEMSCHSAVCRVAIECPEGDGDKALRAIQLVPFADRTSFQLDVADGRFKGMMYLFYGESRDPGVQLTRYSEARRDRLLQLVPGKGRLEGIHKLPSE